MADDLAEALLEQGVVGMQDIGQTAASHVIAALDALTAAELDPKRKSFLNDFAENLA